MSKILYLGHYLNGTSGWNNITRDHILAMDEAGYDIVCRPIVLNEQAVEIPNRIKELEAKDDKNCDILIQHLLPHHMMYSGNFKKNIGIYYSESDNLPLEWSQPLQTLDELWVPNESMIIAARNAGITKPIHVVKPPVDTSKYERTYSELPELKAKLAGDFSFMFLGDLQRRKNLAGIIKAFHTTFSTEEPVSLIIKPTKFNTSPQELENIVRKMSEEIKHGLKLYPNLNDYKQEIIISEQLSNEDIFRLHSTTDCLVSTPFAEAVGMPVIDALGLGRLVIAHSVGMCKDYLTGINEFDCTETYWEEHANCLTITSYENIKECVFGMTEGFPFLGRGTENWWQPSTTAIAERMRFAYNMSERDRKILAKNSLSTVYEFSYECFAQRMKELL